MLDRFFLASRLRDRTALAKYATVIFEPLDRGTVDHFTITKVSAERDTKTVTLAADVHRPDGTLVAERLVVVLQRDPDVGWKVTGVAEAR